jgi:hypothetical protein
MITLWYKAPGDMIQVDRIEAGRVVRTASMYFPYAFSPALFWLAIRALTTQINLEEPQ